jgi:hypothetical protein
MNRDDNALKFMFVSARPPREASVTEQKAVCPRCASELVVSIANQRHCQSCSLDYNHEHDPIGARNRNAEPRGLLALRRKP